MKYLILFLSIIFFSLNNAQAHQPHFDAFLKRLSPNVPAQTYELIKNNIKTFKLEVHYKNKDTKLDKQLKNVLSADKFNKVAYTNIMREIYIKSKKVDVSKSADIISELNKHDRIEFYNAMEGNNS